MQATPANDVARPHPALRFQRGLPEAPDLDDVCLAEHFRKTLHLRNARLRQFLVLACLLSREHGCSYFYQRTAAARLGVSVSTVYRWTQTLCELGLVTARRTGRELQLQPCWEALGLVPAQAQESRELAEEMTDQVTDQVTDRFVKQFEGSDRGREKKKQQSARVAPVAAASSSASPVPSEARPKAPTSAPRAERARPPALAPLAALPGGQGAARVLERASLTPVQQQRVVDRVLAYHDAKGVQDAARFIHGPIADVRDEDSARAEIAAQAEHSAPIPDLDALEVLDDDVPLPPVSSPTEPARRPAVPARRSPPPIVVPERERRRVRVPLAAELELVLARALGGSDG